MFDLSLGLEHTHVLVTGGAGLIGSVVVRAFLAAGANVTSVDINYSSNHQHIESLESGNSLLELHGDITSPESLGQAWLKAKAAFGIVATCVALASLDLSILRQTESIIDADPKDWEKVLKVNVGGTMLTAQCWLRDIHDHIRNESSKPLINTGLIIIGSEAGHFGVKTCAMYAASKSAVQYGLLQSLRADAASIYNKARVNAVAPGPVDTPRFRAETGGPGTQEWWAECEAT